MTVGERAACAALGISRSTRMRRRREPARPVHRQYASLRRLSEAERQSILDVVHTERFADFSVREIYATLLDEGTYLGSISSFYRILRVAGETKERRALATHPARVKPELVAPAVRRVWCWDITKLLGPQKWTYFQLYGPGRTIRVAIALLGAIDVIYLASLWLKYAQHIVWAPIAGGAILMPIILFAMQRWQDTYRSEFDSASAIKG